MPLLSTSNLCYVCPSLYSEHILTNESEVYELLVGIDVTKSTGPDEITGHMIQNTAYSITPAVTAIFNQSICEGKFLTEWKKSRITPVPKSYDRSLVENFRPISILCILSKELNVFSIIGCWKKSTQINTGVIHKENLLLVHF